MKRSTKLQIIGVALAGAVVATAQAQPFNTLKFDINQVDTTITGGTSGVQAGALAASGGDAGTFTGSIVWSMGGFTKFAGTPGQVTGRNTGIFGGGPFVNAGDPGTLASISGTVNFVAGMTTGVGFTFANLAGDTFTTSIAAGGALVWDGTGSYTVTGLTFDGSFAPLSVPGFFGAVDVSQFIAAGNSFGGLFKDIFIVPDQATQTTDLELIVAVPLPGGAAMASLGLLGLATRRRRA